MHRTILLLASLCCACTRVPNAPVTTLQPRGVAPDDNIPEYARYGFEPFGRSNVVAVAEREWRAFGSVVDDSPPDTPLPVLDRPDRQAGLWQRVGDYWFGGLEYGAKENGWTSKYNQNGTPYNGEPPAWSAVFVSYVMRVSGAGARFPYSALHADYINAAARGEGALRAEPPESYAAVPGDLVCVGRLSARKLTFVDLPAPRFFGHCDIVTNARPGELTVIGGNVFGGVTMKHVPTTPQGTLATPDGQVLDTRFPWFVVLRVMYDGA